MAVQTGDDAGCLGGLANTLGERKAKLVMFAPSNSAFEKFLRLNPGALDGLDIAKIKANLPAFLGHIELTDIDLCNVLLKHVAIGEKKVKRLSADELLVLGNITVADRSVFPISVGSGDVMINYEGEITQRDVFTVNGVIHYLDSVLVDAPPPPSDGAVTVFVTDRQFTGAFGGLDGTDAECQSLAGLAGLPGTFTAWLSDSTTSAIDRIPAGQYHLVDGTLVANDKADLTDGILKAPITVDQYGNTLTGGFAWTGTSPDGTGTGTNCGDWTNQGNSNSCGEVGNDQCADAGSIFNFDPAWTDVGIAQQCSSGQKLHCFGGGQHVSAVVNVGQGRRLTGFLTARNHS